MSKDYVIIADSNSEIPLQFAKDNNIDYVPMPYLMGDDEVAYQLGEFVDLEEFYDKVRGGMMPKTSTYSPDYYIGKIEPYLKEGKDILFVSFSSELSSSFGYIKVACDQLREKYPYRKIFEVDTLRISAPLALLVMDVFALYKEGLSIESLAEYIENNRLTYKVYFTVDDINHLKRGGRVSGAAAAVGTMLSIKPILTLSDEGKIIKFISEKGRNKAIAKLASLLESEIANPAEQTIFIGHADDIEAAQRLQQEVLKRAPVRDVIIQQIGPVIGTHCGPGTLCIAYRGAH